MRVRGFGNDTRGQALLEFALILPILLLLVLGIIEFGRIWNINQRVSDITREGARRAVIADQPPTPEQVVHDFMMQSLFDAHVDTSVVTITFSQSGAGAWKASGLPQTVTIRFPYSFMFFNRAFGTVQITSSFTMRNE
jgi:Flp pilus assembly protein TadG